MTEPDFFDFVANIQHDLNREVTMDEWNAIEEKVTLGCTQAQLNEHWRQMRQAQKVAVHSADGETDHETSTHEPLPISLDDKKDKKMTEDELFEFVVQIQEEINRKVTDPEWKALDDKVLKQGCTHAQLRAHWEQMVR